MSTPPPPIPEWAQQPPPPTPPPPPSGMPAGWYQDPWQAANWRWYDGTSWTGHTDTPRAGTVRKPRLPSFLSIPVILTSIPGLALIAIGAVLVPLAIALGFVPLLIVAPVLLWMDRLEPEPWSERLHAFLWGAFVATAVAIVFNTATALVAGESVAAVVSAPIGEEIMKALAIVWAVRRKQVDGIMDGLVYAGFAALGFAIVEDFLYFFNADGEDLLFQTFVGRAILTPFAHPLFTAWTGLAIGLAVRQRRSLWTAWWGLAMAIFSHALWNGSLVVAQDESLIFFTMLVVLGFIGLFFATTVAVVVLRNRDQRRFAELLPFLGQRYGVSPQELTALSTWGNRRRTRRELDRPGRRRFDSRAAALHRLAALYDHPSPPDPADEARLRSQLDAGAN